MISDCGNAAVPLQLPAPVPGCAHRGSLLLLHRRHRAGAPGHH